MTEQDAKAIMAESAAIDQGQVVAAHDAANPPPPGGGPVVAVPPELSAAAEWFMIPKAMAWAITAVLPELKSYYTDEVCMELATAIAPVAEKYGLNGPGDSPELTLLMATGMFCAPAYMVYSAKKAQAIAAAESARQGGAVAGTAGPATHKPTDEVRQGQHGS